MIRVTVVRPAAAADVRACLEIVRSLPDHFTSDVPATVEADLRKHLGRVAIHDNRVLGFLVIERRSQRAAEILWLAVAPAAQRTGVATRLVNQTLDELQAHGTHLVEVKTLDRGVDYQPYEATRAFWERSGFVQIDTIDPLPGWRPGNPAAIYVASLEVTAGHQLRRGR